MKRTISIVGVLILPAVLASLVSACYSPRFVPDVTYLYLDLDKTDIVLTYQPHRVGMATITATLRPSVAIGEETVIWEWNIYGRNYVDFFELVPDAAERESSTRTVIAWSPGTANVTVRASVGGRSLDAVCRITVSVIESHD